MYQIALTKNVIIWRQLHILAISVMKYHGINILSNMLEMELMEDIFLIVSIIIIITRLTKDKQLLRKKSYPINTFYRTGYVFTGWNTKPDGSGVTLADEEDFLIVQDKLGLDVENNNTRVKVYAQWKPAYSTLIIDPNGGSYNGETTITQRFRTVYSLDPNKLTPPAGPIVTYDTQGGNKIEPTHTTTHFSGWTFTDPLHGVFVSASNRYAFGLYDANNIFSEMKSVWYDGMH